MAEKDKPLFQSIIVRNKHKYFYYVFVSYTINFNGPFFVYIYEIYYR